MPRPPQSEEQRELVRRRILGAAREVFDHSGIEAVSMRGVGARVGLTASALYAYFPSKIDLLRALWWDALDELHVRMKALSQGAPDPITAIRELAMAYVDFALEDPARFRTLFMAERGELAAELRTAGVIHEAYHLFRQRVAEATGQGQLRLDDPDLGAQMLWAAVHGTLTLPLSSVSFPFRPPPLLAARLLDALLAGLSSRPDGGVSHDQAS
jgi:AcrR family transcriptional regulator